METIGRLESERLPEQSVPQRFVITSEAVAYLALLALALVLRLAELDSVPLSPAEARQALAAWRVAWPEMAGPAITPESPLLFALHTLSFSTLGGSEFTARLWTALAGVALSLSPALFRGLIGRMRALLFSIVLASSPVLLLASRFDSPVVWTLLIGVAGLWAVWRYWEQKQAAYALLAMVCLGTALLLTDPTGPVFGLILLGAAVFALWLMLREMPEQDAISGLRERLAGWPWLNGLLLTGLVIALVGTMFLMNPSGLSTVSQLLGTGARGFITRSADAPLFYPLLTALFYEPALVVSGLVGGLWLIRRGTASVVEYFLLGWAIFGALMALIYSGGKAEHALWLTLPLAGLAAHTLLALMVETPLWSAPRWSKWLVALALIALLLVLTVHGQRLGRSLLASPDGFLQFAQVDSISAVWVLITPLFMVISFFLAGSVWGMMTALQGAVLGVFIFSLVTSLGSGWNAAVPEADNPVEAWHLMATSRETTLLRDTLTELSRRQSGGFPQMTVMALVPEDGVVAWVLRDYPNTRFISSVAEAEGAEIVLLPGNPTESPDLGGPYVGQQFIVGSTWNLQYLNLNELPAWWMERRTRTPYSFLNTAVLWLRQDVYDGVRDQSG